MAFYDQTDIPLSLSLGLKGSRWAGCVLGILGDETDKQVFLTEADDPKLDNDTNSEMIWCVVDVYWYPEESQMTKARVYGELNEHLPYASIMHDDNHEKKIIVDNHVQTNNTGGQKIWVHDDEVPSDVMEFGFRTTEDYDHQCLVICFRLVPRSEYNSMKVNGIYR